MPPKKRKTNTKPSPSKSKKVKNQENEDVDEQELLEELAPKTSTGLRSRSVSTIVHDPLTKTAMEYWSSFDVGQSKFDEDLVEKIYNEELVSTGFEVSRITLLELSHYLEKYVHSFMFTYVILISFIAFYGPTFMNLVNFHTLSLL